jgi:hypothetical protein
MQRAAKAAVMVLAIIAEGGCASVPRLEPGLANGPALPQNNPIDVHDVIANGHDSCPRARVEAGDPLWHRYPACPGRETAPVNLTLLIAPLVSAPPVGDDLWNVPFRGLPPCEEARAARANELALAVCWVD